MTGTRHIQRGLGLAAACVFVVMAATLQIWIAPNISFSPQSSFAPYSDLELLEIAGQLQTSGLAALYKIILVFVDSLFIVLFGLWVMLAHFRLPNVSWRAFGVILACLFMALDFSEDLMLATRLGLATKGNLDPSQMTDAVSTVFHVTLGKFAAFAASLISTLLANRRTSK